jgi:photosystem II stability/assembly factor-like uncharacterized protein
MKQLIQTLFFFSLVSQICFPQWYQQNSGTSDNLSSIHFEDANIGWAVSYGGALLHTSDGGNNWYTQAGLGAESRSVFFTSPTDGWVVGWSIPTMGFISHTTDGGNNWNGNYGMGFLYSIFFISPTTGWAVGNGILHTTDGGNNWTQQISGIGNDLSSVFFISPTTGWAVGGNAIINTIDGGNNWTQQSSGTTEGLTSIYFTSSTIGWAVGWNGTILKTTDGGNNWNAQTSGTTDGLESVYFTSPTTGWVVGGDFNPNGGTILCTTDGGNNWIEQPSGMTEVLISVFFISPTTGWAVGSSGTILNTTNGGLLVELTSFTATSNGKEVILSWSTASEINNQGFEIQRSTEGVEYFTVGFVNGHGTTTEQQNYSYSDKNLDNGKYFYRLKQVDYDGSYDYSDVVEVEWRAFNSYLLEQNFPNPFNPTTTIGYGLQNKSNVKITILNAIGEEVAVVLNEEREAGFHRVEFNAANLPSGVYFYQLRAGDFVETKKMILLK